MAKVLQSFRGLLTSCVAGLLLAGMYASAGAAELVMFTRDGCPWCARFEREVGPIYPRTEVGAKAPLRRVALEAGAKAPLRRVALEAGGSAMDGLKERVFAAPTFVLFDEGREIGRLTGYPGDDAFWGLLGKMLAGMAAGDHKDGGETRQMGMR